MGDMILAMIDDSYCAYDCNEQMDPAMAKLGFISLCTWTVCVIFAACMSGSDDIDIR